jgi:hypothetical protein
LIDVPSGFDVIDVVLVNTAAAGSSRTMYGIQITRSSKPFEKHHTFDTCTSRSRGKLNELWRVISTHLKLDDTAKKFYVMLAPNCERGQFKPPEGHSNEYYFSPTSIITENDTKRGRNHVGETPSPKKKKKQPSTSNL